MVSYQYSYLIADLVLLVIWFILFFWRKDIRKEMLYISIIFGFVGLLVEPIFLKDWWNPLTIIGTSIAIEDFLCGFFVAGIASVIYSVVFNKKVRIKKTSKKRKEKRYKNFIFIILLIPLLHFGSFYLLNLTGFYSSLISLGIPMLIIWIKRKDLITNSLLSGILAIGVAILTFTITELITPGWVESTWLFINIPKLIILNSPLEDLIWSFFAGTFIGPLYEYWQEGKLINKK